MEQIVRGEKNYEFRKYLIKSTVQRIWFYINAPRSHIGYICEIDPARTRKEGDEPLAEDGLGNKEFNERQKDWDGYDFAYRVRSVYRIRKPISLSDLKSKYGIRGAPRGLVYVPTDILTDVVWRDQELILPAGASKGEELNQTFVLGVDRPVGSAVEDTRKRPRSDDDTIDEIRNKRLAA